MNIYDYKIGDRVTMMSFGKPHDNTVIGYDEPTNQVRLQPIGGMGSAYYTPEIIIEHQKRIEDYYHPQDDSNYYGDCFTDYSKAGEPEI